MSNEYHRTTFCQWMLKTGKRLATEHFVCIFLLTESIVDATPVRVRMITALMIERMPLRTTDK